MEYEIVELKEKIVEGVEIKTTNKDILCTEFL